MRRLKHPIAAFIVAVFAVIGIGMGSALRPGIRNSRGSTLIFAVSTRRPTLVLWPTKNLRSVSPPVSIMPGQPFRRLPPSCPGP